MLKLVFYLLFLICLIFVPIGLLFLHLRINQYIFLCSYLIGIAGAILIGIHIAQYAITNEICEILSEYKGVRTVEVELQGISILNFSFQIEEKGIKGLTTVISRKEKDVTYKDLLQEYLGYSNASGKESGREITLIELAGKTMNIIETAAANKRIL